VRMTATPASWLARPGEVSQRTGTAIDGHDLHTFTSQPQKQPNLRRSDSFRPRRQPVRLSS
jgi:hypothetical protein